MTTGLVAVLLGCGAITLACVYAFSSLVLRRWLPLQEGRGRFAAIDGLRGYLALSVMFHHFIIWLQVDRLGETWASPDLNFFNELGVGAVSLFFMITGLLFYPFALAGIRQVAWPKLIIKRAFRILPALAVSIALVIGVVLMRGYHDFDARTVRNVLIWLSSYLEPDFFGYPDTARINAYVLWSLAFEWQFYIVVLPLLAAAMTFRGSLPTLSVPALLFAAAILARSLIAHVPLIRFLPLFAVGMLAHEIHLRGLWSEFFRTRLASLLALLALCIATTSGQNPLGLPLPFFAIFFVCVSNGADLFGLLTASPSRRLGETSYSIYLMHGIVLSVFFVDLKALHESLPTSALPLLLPVLGLVVTLLAAVVFMLVEKPMIDLGHRLTRSAGARVGAEATTPAPSPARAKR